MNTYLFATTATMKEHNRKNWYIAADIVRDMEISAETLEDALAMYAERVKDKAYIEISKNALRLKSAMYSEKRDGTSAQTGYVITGKTGMYDGRGRETTQYVDLWVSIKLVTAPDFTA